MIEVVSVVAAAVAVAAAFLGVYQLPTFRFVVSGGKEDDECRWCQWRTRVSLTCEIVWLVGLPVECAFEIDFKIFIRMIVDS